MKARKYDVLELEARYLEPATGPPPEILK